MAPVVTEDPPPAQTPTAAFAVLGAVSVSHLLNDLLQSLLPSIYPILKDDFPSTSARSVSSRWLHGYVVAAAAGDRHLHRQASEAVLAGTRHGLHVRRHAPAVSVAHHYYLILLAAALVGTGSAVFHPESSRIARLASGGRYGFAQSRVSGRRQFRSVARTDARSTDRAAFRAGQYRWFLGAALDSHGDPLASGAWYKPRMTARKAAHARGGRGLVPGTREVRAGRCLWCCVSRRRSTSRASTAITRSS